MNVPFFDLKRQYKIIKKGIDKSIKKVLESGGFIFGNQLEKFEKNISKYIGQKYAIGVHSGTDAIRIAAKSIGVGTGDEVITVANTAVPTVSAIRELGAIPIFVDIDEYLTINPEKIKSVITSRTKAILVVHLYGQPADMPNILKVAKKYKIKVMEDCAQAIGSKINGKKVGGFGDVSCFSFYPTKNLGAYGDAGAILTDNKKIADECKLLRMYGMKDDYYANIEGYNSRLGEIQAAILNVKLKYLDKWNARRREIANYYIKNIKNHKVVTPKIRNNYYNTYHLFVIRTKERDGLKKYLAKNGIGSAIHYQFPIHIQKAYRFLKCKKGSLPKTEKITKEILSLPIFPELTNNELKYVTDKINKF